jgi:hypothetical protein
VVLVVYLSVVQGVCVKGDGRSKKGRNKGGKREREMWGEGGGEKEDRRSKKGRNKGGKREM